MTGAQEAFMREECDGAFVIRTNVWIRQAGNVVFPFIRRALQPSFCTGVRVELLMTKGLKEGFNTYYWWLKREIVIVRPWKWFLPSWCIQCRVCVITMCVRGVGGDVLFQARGFFSPTQQWEPVRGQRWADERAPSASLLRQRWSESIIPLTVFVSCRLETEWEPSVSSHDCAWAHWRQ